MLELPLRARTPVEIAVPAMVAALPVRHRQCGTAGGRDWKPRRRAAHRLPMTAAHLNRPAQLLPPTAGVALLLLRGPTLSRRCEPNAHQTKQHERTWRPLPNALDAPKTTVLADQVASQRSTALYLKAATLWLVPAAWPQYAKYGAAPSPYEAVPNLPNLVPPPNAPSLRTRALTMRSGLNDHTRMTRRQPVATPRTWAITTGANCTAQRRWLVPPLA